MSPPMFTVIDEGRPCRVEADLDEDRVLLDPADLTRATGWERKTEGLCRGEVCIPVREPGLDRAGRIDLAAFAAALHRPLALDVDESAAYIGASADSRAEHIGSQRAPEFTLPDLEGRRHSLSDHAGKKVLLVVYASW